MEPLTITVAVVAGALGTAATAIITRAHWTAHTKRLTALGVYVVLTAVAWAAVEFPTQWETIATMLGVVVGAGQTIYTAVAPTGLLDWLRDATSPTPETEPLGDP